MKSLPIKIFEITGAWDTRLMDADCFDLPSMRSYLNLQTGSIEFPNPDDITDGEDDGFFGDPNYLMIPDEFGWPKLDGYQVMVDFVDEVENQSMKSRLEKALQGNRGVFRRFKDVVHGDIETLHHWRWFETCRERKDIENWLKRNDIEPQWDCDIYARPHRPSKRAPLCEAVVKFVKNARSIDGVEMISLIGSLATEKPIPKDVDLLVKVSTEISDQSIRDLATQKRKLLGKTMKTGDSCGADVFICDSENEYLGRMCSYRECHPRRSCEAQSCGDYINDDFHNITLDKSILEKPSITLWPEIAANVEIPQDVESIIVSGLKA